MICVEVIDGRENGDDDTLMSEVIWYAPKSYKTGKELEDKGFEANLNSNKSEQCSTRLGKTPSVTIYSYYAGFSRKMVDEAMKEQGLNFVTRDILFMKTDRDQETIEEAESTANDDIVSEMWEE